MHYADRDPLELVTDMKRLMHVIAPKILGANHMELDNRLAAQWREPPRSGLYCFEASHIEICEYVECC